MTRSSLLFLLALAACSQPPAPSRSETPEAHDSAPVPPAAPAPPAVATTLAEKSDTLDFSYGWPAEAAAVAPLAADLRADAEHQKADAGKAAADDQRAAKHDGFPFHQHSFAKRWSLAGASDGLVSLTATVEAYLGGAHGMQVFDTRLFDRRAGRAIAFDDLFADPAATREALKAPFCAALDRQRTEKRGIYVTAGQGPFSDCPKLADRRWRWRHRSRTGRSTGFR